MLTNKMRTVYIRMQLLQKHFLIIQRFTYSYLYIELLKLGKDSRQGQTLF